MPQGHKFHALDYNLEIIEFSKGGPVNYMLEIRRDKLDKINHGFRFQITEYIG
jgi:hypothetical protein